MLPLEEGITINVPVYIGAEMYEYLTRVHRVWPQHDITEIDLYRESIALRNKEGGDSCFELKLHGRRPAY